MMFTSSDASSLVRELWWWEHAEYVFGALVAAACAGEYIADFNRRPWVKAHKDRIAKTSTLILVCALVFELICITKANGKSDEVIGKLRDEAGAADNLARAAVQSSDIALRQSGQAVVNAGAANSTASVAKGEAKAAKSSALEADTRVRAVQRQADSLNRDIAAEKDDLLLLKSSRNFSNISDIVAALKPFKGTQYQFTAVFPDAESFRLLHLIDNILQSAGWTRMPSPENWIVFDVLRTGEVMAPPTTDSGLRISVNNFGYGMYPIKRLFPPQCLLAAKVLHLQLAKNIFPPEDKQGIARQLEEWIGDSSAVVKIEVGSKPLPE